MQMIYLLLLFAVADLHVCNDGIYIKPWCPNILGDKMFMQIKRLFVAAD